MAVQSKKPAGFDPRPIAKDGSRRGGARPNSGPLDEGEKITAAEYAFRLFVKEMRDETRPIELRLDCAREILNRSWGKPKRPV